MGKIVITEKHLLIFAIIISVISLGLGVYNSYQLLSFAQAISVYGSLSETKIPTISTLTPIYGTSKNIIMFEYLDYLCPYCAYFDTVVLPQLKEKYIDTGKISYAVKNLVVHGEEARNLARYAICIYKDYGPEKFYDFKHTLYKSLYKAIFLDRNYTAFQNFLNETLSKYNVSNCLENKTIDSIINQDIDEAIRYRISGTPGFVILINRNILPENKLKEIKSFLDEYKDRGLSYHMWLSQDKKYVIISFAGAMPFQFFDKLFSLI